MEKAEQVAIDEVIMENRRALIGVKDVNDTTTEVIRDKGSLGSSR